ncbi:MAG: DUF1800 family protein [Verrucomicrobiaceae bacterium]|nr:DUF1800 family protein [Verrucomicrobiaceae bacterium]
MAAVRRGILLAALCCLAGAAFTSVRADINSINQTVWKMKYGVSDAQMADSNWLNNGDDDGDGIRNGAELAAGTNPFVAGSVVKITSITVDSGAGTVSVTFPAMKGKMYVMQGAPGLTGFAALSPSVDWVATADTTKTLTAPQGSNKFFRVLVQDADSDGDGVSDWAENVVGYNPNSATTIPGVQDGTGLPTALANENKVSITATDSSALQPEGTNPAVDVGQVVVARSGTLHFTAITVPLQKTGTAVEGTDYTSLPNSVTIPKNSASVVLDVMPTANAGLKTNRVAMVSVQAGTGYTLAAGKTTASVAINPAGTANGTGLTGRYQNSASATYATQTGIFSGAAEMTRVDPVIDFANSIVAISTGNPCTVTTARPHQIATTATVRISGVPSGTFSPTINTTYTATSTGANTFTVPVNCTVAPASLSGAIVGGTNGWDSATGPVGLSSAAAGGLWSVRWTGQVLPQYSETYSFDIKSDDSAKVWVNGVLLVDRWTTQSATEYVNTIDLKAGTLYDIVVEYWNNGGSAEARLYWWSASQVKQIIPQGRLFPEPASNAAKFTAITSSLSVVGYEGVSFSFALNSPATGAATSYALAAGSAPLPPGLSLDGVTGIISGTPQAGSQGRYNVAVNATNSAAGVVTGSSIIDITIFPAGSVTRETLSGSIVTANGTVPALDDDTDYPNNTSRRLRGYIVPPKTGNYYFWLAASGTAEFWLSNDSESINKVRRATVASSTGNKIWNAQASQQTQWLALTAGQKYYFEVLQNTGADADDYVNLGWLQDDVGTVVAVTGAPNPAGTTPVIANGGAAMQGYPFSGTAPSYIFQPYDYPTVATSTGQLYAANLGPQGSSATKASGSTNMRVDMNGNTAILHFNYTGLSSPRTGYHLHTDAFSTHPAGEIIFDIDDVDAFHPELRTADGGYIWNFATGGTFTTIQQIKDAITLGKVYLNVHSVNFPNGEIRGTLTLVDGSQTPPDASTYPEPSTTDTPVTDAYAARFLNQATYGANPADVAYVKANGYNGWINDQLTKTPSHTSNDVVAGVTADINTPYPSSLFTNAWWKYSISGQDQLRQRLALALSEIMVVSWANNSGPLQNNGRILADYYDQLVDYCLPTSGLADSGNFRGILKQVTLTPAMGLYLDMRANQKGDDSLGRHPNENYAREIMQLFSVGLNRMWDDGKFVIDSNANLVPTYTQPTILGLSALLTGWNYSQAFQANGRLPTSFGPSADYLNPMVLVPTQHEQRYPKLLLNNVVSPAATGITPRVSISSISTGTPCTVNTSTMHGLKVGDTILISNVTGGTFSAAINASHLVTQIVDGDSFKVAVDCSVVPTSYTNAAVTGATVLPAAISGTGGVIAAVTGSQGDSSNFSGWTLPHPYDQYGLTELDRAIDNIVANDNVPPYICRQLIQRFVTSDPSPGYVYRVVQKFKNNGFGVRGDLTAVIKQILLDGEARSTTAAYSNVSFGKQREPMLRLTGPARAFPAAAYTGTYTQLTGVNSHKLRIVTSGLNDFSAGFTVGLNFLGNYTTTSPPNPYSNPTSTNYSVGSTLGIAKTSTAVSGIAATNPCQVTTSEPHGLATGSTVRVSGFTGGTFLSGATSVSISTTSRAITVTSPTTFTIDGINCTVAPTVSGTSLLVSSPCRITTTDVHGLTTGDSITISGVSGGTFSPTISNATFSVTVIDSTSFTIPVACTAAATANTGSIVGGKTFDVSATGMVNVTYSQTAGSNILTVNTGGPATNVDVPGTTVTITGIAVGNPCTVTTSAAHNLVSGGLVKISGVTDGVYGTAINGTFTATVTGTNTFTVPVDCTTAGATGSSTKQIHSRVYLKFLTQTTAGGAVIPADGIYDVQTVSGTSSFTVLTADTPATARGGNVIVPKLTTSYTPTSNMDVASSTNTVVIFNTNVNHNFQTGDHFWVDVPVVASPLTDAEYIVPVRDMDNATGLKVNLGIDDEDHVRISYLPADTNGGTYPKPSGSNNGITIYPLVAPPLGRSGTVVINQSTFNLGSTESTLAQSPLNAPTVFNFFYPDYKFPGTLSNAGVDSPEFQLSTDTNLSNITNSMTNMVIGTGGGNGNLNGLMSFNNGNGNIVLDIGSYMTPAKTANAGIPALVDELGALLVGGPLDSTTTRQTIIDFASNTTYFPYTSPTPTNQQMRDRVRAIIHLILTSAEYAVQK